jgi:hypothetical protein
MNEMLKLLMIIYELKNLYSKNICFCLELFSNEFILFRLISTDSTQVERWATGLNDYWPRIQNGLVELPVEINAIAERINEECKHEDEVINDHLDMLIELLQGYKVREKNILFYY